MTHATRSRTELRHRGPRGVHVALAMLLLSLFATPVGAQDPATAREDIEPSALQVVSWTRVGSGVEAVVAVPALLSARELADAAFGVEAGGRSVPFTMRHLDVAEVDLALVITSDATTLAQPAGDSIRAAVVEFGAALAPGARVAVVADEPPRVLTTLTVDRAELGPALTVRGIAPASIDPALRLANDALAGARRPIVVMVGPALPDAGNVPAWWPPGTPLYAVRVAPTERSAGELSRNRTGGFSATRPATSVVSALDVVALDLRSQYRITVPDVPVGTADLAIRVRAAEVDSQATVVLAPPATERDPAGTGASGSLPSSTPAEPVEARRLATHDSGPPWSAVAGVVLLLGLFAAAAIFGRKATTNRDRTRVVSPAGDPTDDAGAPTAPAEVTIVLSNRDGPHSAAALEASSIAGVAQTVSSPEDALRAVIRRHATTLVIEPGATNPWPLVRAVANHDRASGGHTRVIQVASTGALIDLTLAVAEHGAE